MVQGPPIFINVEGNFEEEGGKASAFFRKLASDAQKYAGNVAAKAQEKLAEATGKGTQAIQSQEEIMRKARQAADDLIKSYFGLEKFQQAQASAGSRDPNRRDDIIRLQKEAEALRARNVPPEFSTSGVQVVDRRSVENAKRVEEELSLTAQSTKQVRGDTKEAGKNLGKMATTDAPRLRYAMYDISNSARRIATALGALAIGPIAAAIQYEKDFANVVRTTGVTGDAIEELQLQLREIAQLTPIPWADITAIATLAGQLGIAETSVANFTETVAKFSATTDLTVEASATAFGRLDQLIDGVNGQFNNLGSAILAVGVDSVATESQIVNVSTQIASMGNLAQLSAADIIGLSGALASLGIRPELARGTVTRLFSNIGAAVAQGGRNLEEYGRLTNRTAEEFAEAWQSEPTEVLLDFFEGVQREGGAAERTLREIGITSVRDIPAILRLAQSQDEVRRLVALSNDEFQYGLAVNEQYGIISETVAAQIQRLGQNFQTLFATLGEGTLGPLNAVIAGFNSLVEGLTGLNKTPGGATFLFIAGTVTTLGFVLAGLVTVLTSVFAGFLAYRLALKEMGVATGRQALGNLFLAGTFTGVEKGAKKASIGVRIFTTALLGGLFVVPLLVAGIAGLASAFNKSGESAEDAKEKAEQFFGDTGAFIEAVKEDTKDFNKEVADNFAGDFGKAIEEGFKGDAIDVQTIALNENQDEARAALDATIALVDGQEKLEGAVAKTTNAISEQTIAYGQNALEFLRNAFIQNVQAQNFAQNQAVVDAARALGLDFQELLAASLAGGGIDYLEGVRRNIIDQLAAVESELFALTDTASAVFDPLSPRIAELEAQSELLNDTLISLETNLLPAVEAVDSLRVSTEAALANQNLWNDSLAETGEYATLTADQIDLIIDRIFGLENRLEAAEQAANSFGLELRETGLQGEGLRGNIEDLINTILLLDTGPEQQIANLAALLAFMRANALGTPEALQAIQDAIYEVGAVAAEQNPDIKEFVALMLATGGAGVADIGSILDSITDGLNGIGDSAERTGGKIKTLQERFDELLDSIFGPINAARSAAQAIFDLGEAYAQLGEDALFSSKEIQEATRNILATSGSPEEAVANLNALYSRLAQVVGSETAPSLALLAQVIQSVSQEFGVAADIVSGATIDLNFFNRGLAQTTQEVRTLSDFAGDLRDVISRAFDLRFAKTFDIDRIADAWDKLSSNVEDARYQVDELLASQQDLGADRALKEYFLSVAEAYNDTLRAAQLRKEIAELDREQTQNARELAEAQQVAGGVLSGQGAGIRQNRGALLDLVQNYQDYITTLAESGASQDELREATERARREFVEQARELGFQEDVVQEYAQAFDDVTFAINNVPRNITVEFNANPALQALNELNAKLNDSIDLARELNRVSNVPTPAPTRPTQPTQPVITIPTPTPINIGPGGIPIRWIDRLFAEGGFTGRGGRMEPAGIVHRGEYVIPKQYVNQSTGLPDPSFLAQLQNGLRGYQMGGFVGGGGMAPGEAMMVELSPYDRKLLENAGNVQLRLNGRVVAEATNRSNSNEARRGSN